MQETTNPAAGGIGKPGEEDQFQKNNNALHYKEQVFFDAGDIIRAIESAGLTPPETIINDGSIHRFSSNGDRSDKAGYYCLFNSGGGFFGCWRAGVYQAVNPSGFDAWTDQDRAEYRDRIQKAKAEAKEQREREHAAAAEKALQIWESAKPSDPEHPYLKKKQIGTHGARQTGKTLIYSITDATGKIISLQSIDEAGNKKFLPGGRISGGFYIIGHGDFEHGGGICEGIATGASIYEATGKPVICALISGNLPAVAKQFKNYPFIIYADNDIQTTEKIGKNPGLLQHKRRLMFPGFNISFVPLILILMIYTVKRAWVPSKNLSQRINPPAAGLIHGRTLNRYSLLTILNPSLLTLYRQFSETRLMKSESMFKHPYR